MARARSCPQQPPAPGVDASVKQHRSTMIFLGEATDIVPTVAIYKSSSLQQRNRCRNRRRGIPQQKCLGHRKVLRYICGLVEYWYPHQLVGNTIVSN